MLTKGKRNIILKDETCNIDSIQLKDEYYISFKKQNNNIYKAEFRFDEEENNYKKLLSFMHRAIYSDNKIYLKEKEEYILLESYINRLEEFNKNENLVTMYLQKIVA